MNWKLLSLSLIAGRAKARNRRLICQATCFAAIGLGLFAEQTFAEKAPAPIKVACVGDSITIGFGLKNRAKESYPAQLGVMLGSRYLVKNFGHSGRTVLKNDPKTYWESKAFGQALRFQPDVVIIKLGTNDSKPDSWKRKAEYVADYVALIERFQSLPSKPEIFICYPAPVYPGKWGSIDAVIKNEVIPRIDEVAKQTKVEVIDLYSALSNKKELFPDGVHPGAEGAGVLAQAIAAAITN